MEVRRCNFRDEQELLEVRALQVAAYEVEAAMIGSRGMAALRESLEELRGSAEVFFGCFVPGNGCVGIVAVEGADGSAGVWISRLAVRPDWFGRGVGRRLVRHVLGAATQGEHGVRVMTGAANAPARRLYEGQGFLLVKERAAPDGTPIVEYAWRPGA